MRIHSPYLLHRAALLGPACLSLVGFAATQAAAQGLSGQAVQLTFRTPNTSTIFFSDGTQTVMPNGTTFNDQNSITTFVTPTQIRFTNGTAATHGFGGGGAFNGYALSETGTSPATITNVTLDASSTLPGFNAGDLSFDAGDVFADFQGLAFAPGQNVTLDLTFAPVPEASTMVSLGLLLALGLGGVIAAGRRKKAGKTA